MDSTAARARHLVAIRDAVFVNQVIARTAVAALRSAGIRHWQLRDDHEAERLAPGELVRQALAVQRALSQ